MSVSLMQTLCVWYVEYFEFLYIDMSQKLMMCVTCMELREMQFFLWIYHICQITNTVPLFTKSF